jgi:hypothetical protein
MAASRVDLWVLRDFVWADNSEIATVDAWVVEKEFLSADDLVSLKEIKWVLQMEHDWALKWVD